MDQETITRFVNRIISKEPEEAIRYSLLQYEVLCDNDGSFDDYFRQLSSDNFIYAAFIYHCFKQENNFKSSSVEDILLSRLKEFSNQHGGSTIDVNQGVESRDDRNNLITEIKKISEICIMSIILSDNHSLMDYVFQNNVNRLKRTEENYRVFLSHFTELTELLENNSKCFCAVTLLSKLAEFYDNENHTFLLMVIRLLARKPLQYDGQKNSSVLECIREIYRMNNPFVLRQMLLLFPDIDFKTFSTDINAFLRLYKTCSSHNNFECNIIQLIMCAKILYVRSDIETQSDVFIRIVNEEYNDLLANNCPLKHTIETYFICDNIIENPLDFDKLLSEPIVFDDVSSKALEVVEQAAFLSLVKKNPERVLLYLKRLNTANAFRLNAAELNKDISNVVVYKSQLKKLSSYYVEKDLAYIYLNSHLRFFLSIEELFKLFYEKAEVKRDDFMTVTRTFDDYLIDGHASLVNSKFVVRTNQFCTKYPNLAITGYKDIPENEVKRIIEEKEGYVQLKIRGYTLRSKFSPQIAVIMPGENRNIILDIPKLIDSYNNTLRQIAIRGEYTEEDIKALSNMMRFNRYSDSKKLGLQIVYCCCAFNDNAKSISFLSSLHYYPFKMPETSSLPLIEDAYFNKITLACKRLAESVTLNAGSVEDKLFIYFNTLLKLAYPFTDFLFGIVSDSKHVNYCSFSERINYPMDGRITFIKDNAVLLRPRTFLEKGDWKVICSDLPNIQEFKAADAVTFRLSMIDHTTKRIYVKDLEKIQPKGTRFCEAMEKASLTTELNDFDLTNLGLKPIGLEKQDYKRLAQNEIKAINHRINDRQALDVFLSKIEYANPWTDYNMKIPCILGKDEVNAYELLSTINDLISSYPVDFAIEVYFKTSLRSAFTLDGFVKKLLKKHKDNSLIFSAISHYNVYIKSTVNGKEAFEDSFNNVLWDYHHFSYTDSGKYVITGFNWKTKRVILEKLPNA